ncbi:MAG: DUF2202 domain-containing protein [Myxococcales bacterium]|nr:DUF2202 domain-containing protein [Myxococcales bacterium]
MRNRVLVVLGLLAAGCSAQNAPEGSATEDDPGDVVAGTLSQAEADSLRFMREEEKLARDVYRALDDYGKPFSNIQGSEQQHFDSIGVLLDRYDIPDPAEGRAEGDFENADLQALYGTLVEEGAPAQRAALVVGCRIEELDIRDLEAAKDDTDREDILAVYDALLLGSRNHLRAFHGKLVAIGGTYAPQFIDQSTFDAIVGSAHERGGR